MPGRLLLGLLLLATLAAGGLDLSAPESTLLQPRRVEPPLAHACADGRLRLVSWNVHRFRGSNSQGARQQEHQILDELENRRAEVFLLQEVPPERAQETVDELGMPGYQSLTLPDKSGLVLVHPELQVLENRRLWLHPAVDPVAALEGYRQFTSAQLERQYYEPRTAQLLTLRLPSGARVLLFHTHLTSGPPDYRWGERPSLRELRLEQARTLVRALEASGLPVLGGGDLNGFEVADELRNRGYTVDGQKLDWLVTSGVRLDDVQVTEVRDSGNDELRLSDHPIVSGTCTF